MLTVEDYRQRAKDCVEKAQTAPEPERTNLLELASAWLKLADEGVLMPKASANGTCLKALRRT